MFIHPTISPVVLSVGPFSIHWYGVMYAISFLIGWKLIGYRMATFQKKNTEEKQAENTPVLNMAAHNNGKNSEKSGVFDQNTFSADLVFYLALGVIIGGRIGYMLFYAFPLFIQSPLMLFRIWEGGMSFHGGFIGVLLAIACFAKKYHYSYFFITDLIAPIVPIGLGAGRIGNFIGDPLLMGRVTHVPWAMVNLATDSLPRHPVILYEFLLEGVLLFLILWIYARKTRTTGFISCLFLISYGLFRFCIEFFRQPDAQLGFIAWHWLTMGQLLSIPMLFSGILLWLYFRKRCF